LEEHTTLDIGHTQLNEKMLRNLLQQQPERVTILSQIGGASLDAYGAYLNQCLSLAQAHRERLNQENLVYAH
jgi:type II secretory pathway predicted ATPase ExeA